MNFKHFLKAENSEDCLASSCVEFSIGLSCNPVWDWVTVGTNQPELIHKLILSTDKDWNKLPQSTINQATKTSFKQSIPALVL